MRLYPGLHWQIVYRQSTTEPQPLTGRVSANTLLLTDTPTLRHFLLLHTSPSFSSMVLGIKPRTLYMFKVTLLLFCPFSPALFPCLYFTDPKRRHRSKKEMNNSVLFTKKVFCSLPQVLPNLQVSGEMRSQEYRTSSITGSRKVELNALNRTDSRLTCIKVIASNEVVVRAMNFNVPDMRAWNILSTDSQIW